MKTGKELGAILKDQYDNAPRGEQATMIHLFGIEYAFEIKASGIKQVVTESEIGQSYVSEVNKGVKLAKYVKVIKS